LALAKSTDDSREQESRAVARKPRDAAAVRFDLQFADNIHYKFKEYIYRHKTDFNEKLPFNVIQGHVFWSQWKGDKCVS